MVQLDPQVRSGSRMLTLLSAISPGPLSPVLAGTDDEASQGLVVTDYHWKQFIISFITSLQFRVLLSHDRGLCSDWLLTPALL